MEKTARARSVGDVVANVPWIERSQEPFRWLAQLLQREGTDLLTLNGSAPDRGTPVYVHAEADVMHVQHLMARHHIRRVPVIRRGVVLGVVDLVDLALLDDASD